ncbi:MAG: ATP-dependent DNA helicase, partial [Bacteroidia bacterium]|nr:ATP-dependent DNA helicase [Bacteroidia bacterium]
FYHGTYIRVGSTNRLADAEIIAELERQKQNISFDSELTHQKTTEQLNLKTLKAFYFEKTGERLTPAVMKKLDLFRDERGKTFPTNALVLLSDDDLRGKLFPYAKIECARFKGIVPGNFIDQKPIEESICIQPDEAYKFVLRHISEGSTDYIGVYRNDRWEYPVIAIREVIRNAVIHRDYSITGSDIKIAIFDDKIEITSPGLLPPSVDYNDMEVGQSRIRNKILAPVFKRLGIIEQWGNGLQLISVELKKYHEIGFEWKEPGLSFRVTFVKRGFKLQQEQQHELQHELQHEPQHELQHELDEPTLYSKVLLLVKKQSLSMKGISEELHQKNISGQFKKIVSKLLKDGLIEWTIPDSPNNSKQRHRITPKGIIFLDFIKKTLQ